MTPITSTAYSTSDSLAPAEHYRLDGCRLPRRRGRGCWLLALLTIAFSLLFVIHIITADRINILVMGLDARPQEGNLGRTDTLILTTFMPARPYLGALSIPRDLWVTLPKSGENRINAAYFLAEAAEPGSGAAAAVQAVSSSFGVDIDYYVCLRFDSLSGLVDALGGLDIELDEPMSGYTAGVHHLNGTQVLAFVRDRQGSDDFARMARGQIFFKATWQNLLRPANWPRLPSMLVAAKQTVDTNIPLWLWPRLLVTLLRVGPDRIDARLITPEQAIADTTLGGASVLNPDWTQINPILLEMFGQ